jgi:hypothetical protein
MIRIVLTVIGVLVGVAVVLLGSYVVYLKGYSRGSVQYDRDKGEILVAKGWKKVELTEAQYHELETAGQLRIEGMGPLGYMILRREDLEPDHE